MNTPRKHAEIIKAWADGAQVQIFNFIHDAWADADSPDFYPDHQYRIKPEPKSDVKRILDCYGGSIRITIDGETGKLKSAEAV